MFRDKLKDLMKTDEDVNGNDKKKMENIVFFIVILIIMIVAINFIWNGKKSKKEDTNSSYSKQLAYQNESGNYIETSAQIDNSLEKKLEEILSNIQGVGEVKVLINYAESSETVPMYNENAKTSTTEESDTSGGTRKIQETDSQKDIIYKEESGEKIPITQKIIQPKVEGAIITAKGASDAVVKTNIVQAIEAITGLATHKIQVFEMK